MNLAGTWAELLAAGEPGELSAWALDWSGVLAIVLALVHVASPKARSLLAGRQDLVSSFAGGMAIAFVFLHLLPQLDRSHHIVGEAIYLIVLMGFLFFYTAEHTLNRKRETSTRKRTISKVQFSLHLAFAWVYSWLLMYAMPTQIQMEGVHAVPIIAALGLHLLQQDYSLGREFVEEFDQWGRYLLAAAPLIGWLADYAIVLDKFHSDILTGFLAGWSLYNVLKMQLPEHREASLRWFLSGVVVFLLLTMAAARM